MTNLRLHFCICIFLLLCLMLYPISCKINLTSDESALLALKHSVTDPYNHLANWSSISSSICNWIGVTCHDSNHWRVKALNLSKMGLKGTLPLQIGNLSFLVELDLHNNNFFGELPKELIHLNKLKVLNLSYNQFHGDIPTWIGSLFSLQHLILESNNFGGVIPPSISNLSQLETLDWTSNFVEGSIPLEIGKLQRLKILRISINNLSRIIPPTISNLSLLEQISLSINSLSGNIPNEFGDLQNLKTIYLDNNRFSGQIPSTIFNILELQEIELADNNLTGDIPNGITNLTNADYISLSGNQLSGRIPKGIGNLTILQELYLDHNNLQGDIPKEFGDLQNLKTTYLGGNGFSGHIPSTIFNMSKLQTITLGWNNLSGGIPSYMCHGLPKIQYLSLTQNELSGALPSDWVQCKELQMLAVDSNRFTGYIPRKIANLTMLQQLYLGRNFFTGIILLRFKRRNSSKDLVDSNVSTLGVPRRISYFEIQEATNGFDESNLLGSGSYGSVFRGKLRDGTMVAVKVFNFDSEAMSRSFEVECDAMRNVRHRNLVKIVASCSNSVDFKSLIMEFMPQGSLEKWLYSYNYCLDFLQRLNVMIDVASALEYLHHGLSTPIIHCDLKPSNILLDDDMIAHVSDFGISKLLDKGQSMTHTETIPTIGYIAPEYGSFGIVSTKADVYSYGITLIEAFTRKKPIEDMFVSGINLKNWVSASMPHAIIQIIDSNLLQGDERHIDNILTCTCSILELALNCCDDVPEARNNMTDVVASLNKIKILFKQRNKIIFGRIV